MEEFILKQAKLRTEIEIFKELSILCSTPGYIQIISYFIKRDTVWINTGSASLDLVHNPYNPERLIRTEISLLVGLCFENQTYKQINLDLYNAPKIIEATELLLKELHEVLVKKINCEIENSFDAKKAFMIGEVLREPMFYSGESAYPFQYIDLGQLKYSKDDDWFKRNKGFSISNARQVFKIISFLQDQKLSNEYQRGNYPNFDISVFTFKLEDIAEFCLIDKAEIQNIIHSFSANYNNCTNKFNSIHDFNITNAYPILEIEPNIYMVLQFYSLAEAFYETPFFWLLADKQYSAKASEHRGAFPEEFSRQRLIPIFKYKNVFSNLKIGNSKKIYGEMDLFVVFGNVAIILQAKAKKLTYSSRSGNDLDIQKDFTKAVQEAYDQGLSCAKLILSNKYNFYDCADKQITFLNDFKSIYIICIVGEHYPALFFQSRNFLKYQSTEIIKAPFIMDVFFLDVLSEMLNSPLYFLNYIDRRVNYIERVNATHENDLLAWHLHRNLWLQNDNEYIYVDSGCSEYLDRAMFVRRVGALGENTPPGILTKLNHLSIGKIIKSLSHAEDKPSYKLGNILLQVSEITLRETNKCLKHLVKLFRKDRKTHEFTPLISDLPVGLSFVVSTESNERAYLRLEALCCFKLGLHDRDCWLAVCLDPKSLAIRFLVDITSEYVPSDTVLKFIESNYIKRNNTPKKKKKQGRNDPCLCGSHKKYKYCHGLGS